MSYKYTFEYDKPLTPADSSNDHILNQERMRNGTQQGANGATANASVVTSRNPGQWSSSDHIRIPQYQTYSVRLSSFARWPNNIRQRPELVADAGFYYTGLQDVVRCFACDGGLKSWDPGDDPWIEHARWFPQCPFVKCVKGQKFIDMVRRMVEESDKEEDAVVHSAFQPNNPMADAPNLRNELNPQLDQENDQSVIKMEAAKKCLTEMGFSRDVKTRAMNELLKKGKNGYISIDIISEVILNCCDRGQLPSGTQRETSLPSSGPSARITRCMVNENGCKAQAKQISSFEANTVTSNDASFDTLCRSTVKSANIRQYRNAILNEIYRMMSNIDMVVSEAEQLFGHERSCIFFDLLDTELCNWGSAGAISEFVPNMAESTNRQSVISFVEHASDTMNRLRTLLLGCPDGIRLQQMPEQKFISLMKSVITSSLKTKTK